LTNSPNELALLQHEKRRGANGRSDDAVYHAALSGLIPPFRLLARRRPNVRFGSLAGIGARISDVRFTPKSGHA
jgi:hypothetical protein